MRTGNHLRCRRMQAILRPTHIVPALLVLAVSVAIAQSTTAPPAKPTTSSATVPATMQFSASRPLAVRGGIGNFVAKLQASKDVTVAFFGGPITAGGGPRGYGALVVRWIGSQYPGARVRLVNAGLVDGGSPLGAARFERDVAPYKPDLLFIDFAIDDAEKDDRTWHVERIVHKAWTADPTTDLVMLYGLHEGQLGDYHEGKLPPVTAAHDRIAERYGIPA